MQVKKRVTALLLVLAMLSVMVLSACGTDSEPDQTAQEQQTQEQTKDPSAQAEPDAGAAPGAGGGQETGETKDRSLKVGVVSSGECFDRASIHGFPDYFGIPLVYDSLFVLNPDTGECEQQLVDTFTWEDDLHITITLKDGVRFSDGTQMTGEDVIATMYRFIETGGSQMSNFTMFDFDNSYVHDDDPLTFTLAYNTVLGMGEQYLSSFEILPKAWIETAEPDDWYNAPVGSGPYRLVSNDGVTKVFERRDDYWDRDNLPEAETISVKYYTDQTSLFIDFLGGALDIAYNISEADMADALSGSAEANGYTAVVQPDNGNVLLVLCDHVEAFQDINVRKAVAHAIDTENATVAAYGVLATPATSVLPADFSQCVEGCAYSYDPELSKQLLSEAGYQDGDISFRVVCTNSLQTVNMAEAVQAYLSAVGINMTVESYDIPTAVGMWMGRETDLMLQSKPSLMRDPYQIFEPLSSGYSNPSTIVSDETFNEYVRTGASSLDQDVRTEAYQNAQKWLYENYWVIPICDTGTGVAYNSRIASCNSVSPMYSTNLRYVTFTD